MDKNSSDHELNEFNNRESSSSVENLHLGVSDALRYLDEVKRTFSSTPNVYGQFLVIMKDFKAQTITTSEVIDQVNALFAGHDALLEGFDQFLPTRYRKKAEPAMSTAQNTLPSKAQSERRGAGHAWVFSLGGPWSRVE